jgi:hypothetical protein
MLALRASNYYVGVGTGTPTFPLDVVGNVNTSGNYLINGAQIAAANVTNAVSTAGAYADPAWLTALSYSKLTGAPAMVNSFNARTGAVVPAAGDYSAAMVTNAVDSTGSYADPAWITALSYAKLTGVPSNVTNAVPNTRQVIAGTALTGGGALSADVTLNANIAAIQTPWLQNINAATFNLTNVGKIGVGLSGAPSYPVHVSSSGMGFASQINTATGTADYTWVDDAGFMRGAVCVGGTTNALLGMAFYTAPLSNNVAAGSNIRMYISQSASAVGVGNALAAAPMSSPGIYLQVGTDSATTLGRVMVCSNQPTASQVIGELDFVNFANAAVDKRIAYIACSTATTGAAAGFLSFYTADSAAAGERMRINRNGLLQAGSFLGGADFFNFYSPTANQGLVICTNVATGGTLALRSNTTINYLQSGNQTNVSAQEFRLTGNNASPVWLEIQASSAVVATSCPTAASDTALVANNMVYCYINEAGNALTFRVKFSTGTIKQGTITVA